MGYYQKVNKGDDTETSGPPDQIDDQDMFKPMDWVCKHCGHHQGLSTDQPDKCEKCGMSGASASV
jgi:hypothetical protein